MYLNDVAFSMCVCKLKEKLSSVMQEQNILLVSSTAKSFFDSYSCLARKNPEPYIAC